MPIFDFSCHACDARFELLVRASSSPVCPTCGSANLEKLFSMPAVRSESTRDVVKRETTARDRAQGRERVEAQRSYERHHDD